MDQLPSIQFLVAFNAIVKNVMTQSSNSEADNTSSYSDLLSWKINPEVLKEGRTTMLLVLLLSFLPLNPIQEIDLRERILKISRKWSSEGSWSVVTRMVTSESFAPGEILSIYLEYRSLSDLFGNDLKQMKRIKRALKTYNPYAPDRRPVKKTARKRGYDDKGHLPRPDKLRPEHYYGTKTPQVETKEIEPTSTTFFSDIMFLKREETCAGDLGREPHLPSLSNGSSLEKKTSKIWSTDEERQKVQALTHIFLEKEGKQKRDIPYSYSQYLLWERWRERHTLDFNDLNPDLRRYILSFE